LACGVGGMSHSATHHPPVHSQVFPNYIFELHFHTEHYYKSLLSFPVDKKLILVHNLPEKEIKGLKNLVGLHGHMGRICERCNLSGISP
jgi:hypothetical protein